jgi:2-keto-3-deoxy-6-phosphogluconate aldolase
MADQLASLLDLLPPIAVIRRGITPAEIPQVAATLVARGFRVIEVPLNSPPPKGSRLGASDEKSLAIGRAADRIRGNAVETASRVKEG